MVKKVILIFILSSLSFANSSFADDLEEPASIFDAVLSVYRTASLVASLSDQDEFFKRITLYNFVCLHYKKYQTTTRIENLNNIADLVTKTYLFNNNATREIDTYLGKYGNSISPTRKRSLDNVKLLLKKSNLELDRVLELDVEKDFNTIKSLYSAYKASYIGVLINQFDNLLKSKEMKTVGKRIDIYEDDLRSEMMVLFGTAPGVENLNCPED